MKIHFADHVHLRIVTRTCDLGVQGREREEAKVDRASDQESTADLQTIVSINGDNGAAHRPMRRK